MSKTKSRSGVKGERDDEEKKGKGEGSRGYEIEWSRVYEIERSSYLSKV